MKTIDIRTTQNVVIEYELASAWERVVGFIIDFIVVLAIYVILMLLLATITSGNFFESDMFIGVLLGIVPVALFMLYQFLSEAIADGQSWGKRAVGIRVVRLDGKEPGLTDFLLRAVLYLVDAFVTFGILGLLFIVSSDKSQRLGDLTANTTVIRSKPSNHFGLAEILRINTLENYTPNFPEVRRLNESDMLAIKQIINRCQKHPNAAHRAILNDLVTRLCAQLGVQVPPRDKLEFLKTLIRDYIVLTR
ncbi:MAG: RDD family protein [Lewinellaceae bacterium]|nr:RDD family protein [Lewinella sp.]MCB9277970.1 RDD family protein [Lewinellaceae bacterium]